MVDNYNDEIKALEDQIAELKKKQQIKQDEEKAVAKETRRAAADEVKAAITARITAERSAQKQKAEAYKKYLEECDTIDKSVDSAKKVVSDLLKSFCEKYGSFHDTITLSDENGGISYRVSYEDTKDDTALDAFRRLFYFGW